ncbi:hypothetical protein HW555_006454, partial [Spodoptera exigua]
KGEFAAILSRVLRATVASTRCVPTREHLGRNSVRNMELNEAVSLWLAYRRWKRQKRRENRMYLVHPILNDRMTHSMFETLYPKLRQHEKKFFNYFRMSVKSFDDLLLLIEEDLSPRANYVPREDVVSAEQKLVITLRLKIRFNQRHGFGRVQDIHYPENLLMMLTENLRIMMPVKISALKYNCVLAMLLWMAFLGHILDKKIHLVLKVVHVDIVKTCCLLQNFIHKEQSICNLIVDSGFELQTLTRSEYADPLIADNVRQKFAEYFVSPQGNVPWQNKY